MPSQKLTDQEWETIRRCSEYGVEDSELSNDYGITRESIRQRRKREGWLTKAKIEEEVKKKSVTTQSQKTPEEMIANQIVELLDKNSLRVSQMADKAIRDVSDAPPKIEGWQDALTAYKMLRLAAGVDKEGKSIQINFGAIFNAPAEATPVTLEADLV